MAEIDREQLLHVARLARLELREDELDRLGAQLNNARLLASSERGENQLDALGAKWNNILAPFSKVPGLDLSDVPPTSHPLDVVNVWGEDEPHESLPVDEALANALEREGSYFRVPPGGAS